MTYVESSLSRSSTNSTEDRSFSPSTASRPKRKSERKPKEVSIISEDSSSEDIPLARNRTFQRSPKAAIRNDSDSDTSESDIVSATKQSCKRRKRIRHEDTRDRESETPALDMTLTRRSFALQVVSRLLREHDEDSEPFAEPVDAVAENVPTYHTVIRRAMDLRTLKENLNKGVYSTVEDFEADFVLIIENSILFNGLAHEVSQGGIRLLNAFNALMASVPGRG